MALVLADHALRHDALRSPSSRPASRLEASPPAPPRPEV
jgi:hypothetical protein